jgi:hypothetical protein
MNGATNYLHMLLERARRRERYPLHGIRASLGSVAHGTTLRRQNARGANLCVISVAINIPTAAPLGK